MLDAIALLSLVAALAIGGALEIRNRATGGDQ